MAGTLNKLLKLKIVRDLLSMDVAFRGSIVAHALSGDHPKDFWSAGNVAHATALSSTQTTVERYLYPKASHRSVEVQTHGKIVKYCLTIDGEDAYIAIHFHGAGTPPVNFVQVDVDMLALTRTGLFIVSNDTDESFLRCPVPLLEIMKRCAEREFKVVEMQQFFPDHISILNKQTAMINSGWRFVGGAVKYTRKCPSDVCCVCQESLQNSEEVVKTSCAHYYHSKCWKKHCDHSIQKGKEQLSIPSFVPPHTWSNPDTRGTIYVECPMCRASFKSWETVLPEKPL
ncbi:MAG: hypothetical protein CMD33_01295 [Flavobacteriales bacterium]|nr:hypothetical protein [Flavobacteriales bacterium]